MSCKSALYAAMQTPTAVAVGGVIPLGGLIRRYGCDIALNGNAINLAGTGYYDVDASITATLTAAGAVTATLYKDGVAVPGASATETGAASVAGFGGDVTVTVTIQGGYIADITVDDASGEDAAYFSMAEDILEDILAAQSAEVDTVSGATFSSTGLKNAVAAALEEAS